MLVLLLNFQDNKHSFCSLHFHFDLQNTWYKSNEDVFVSYFNFLSKMLSFAAVNDSYKRDVSFAGKVKYWPLKFVIKSKEVGSVQSNLIFII